MEDDEKRGTAKPVPENLNGVLNEVQMLALSRIEGFGWQLQFVRRPEPHHPIPVVSSPEGNTIGILDEDGRVNLEYHIRLRG